jgi:hypothetical protein
VVRDALSAGRAIQRKRKIAINHLNLLLAIRTDSMNGLPPAYEYLSHFAKQGWSLESLIILDYNERKHRLYFDFGAPVCSIVDAAEMVHDRSQHQLLVGQARNHFGWA